jgi:phage terminase large subunit-like protein
VTPDEQLLKLQQLRETLRLLWDCGVPGCDGSPGHRVPPGVIIPFPHARSKQLAPAGDWRAWFMCTGRGFGKTRAAAEWVKKRMLAEPKHRVGIIAPDFPVGKNVCMEGESGLLTWMPKNRIKHYNTQTATLNLTNGSSARIFGTNSQPDAEKVRGYQFATLWFEEMATQRYGEVAWDISQFALRLGIDPRIVITSTPRNNQIIRRLLKTEPGIAVTTGSTLDNAANLAETTVQYLRQRYEGTTLGKQELEGLLLETMPGALWSSDLIDRSRISVEGRSYQRVVVAIDPAGSHKKTSDETGIVVVGQIDEHYYVLADYSGRYTPDEWANTALMAYNEHRADRIIGERNYGGDMVENTLRAINRSVSYTDVQATRGKLLRAEPIKALYEQNRVHHPDPGYPELEDQMTSWVPPGQFETDERTGAQVPLDESKWSPDRLDALVWGLTFLSQKRTFLNYG